MSPEFRFYRLTPYVVNHRRAKKRPVQISRRNALEAIVDAGLAEGERVIVYPSDAVRAGVRVEPR